MTKEIIRLRTELESYITRDPHFLSSLVPISLHPDAPPVAVKMAYAAGKAGVGPMAAVAGAFAQAACEKALSEGAPEAIVENGGDLFLCSQREIVVGLYAGHGSKTRDMAFAVKPEFMPMAICSSSGTMGHSLSFGKCDLATIIAPDAALADAVATLACNSVKSESDIEPTLNRVLTIEGVLGALIVLGDRIGLIGTLPELVKSSNAEIRSKVTRNPSWIVY